MFDVFSLVYSKWSVIRNTRGQSHSVSRVTYTDALITTIRSSFSFSRLTEKAVHSFHLHKSNARSQRLCEVPIRSQRTEKKLCSVSLRIDLKVNET